MEIYIYMYLFIYIYIRTKKNTTRCGAKGGKKIIHDAAVRFGVTVTASEVDSFLITSHPPTPQRLADVSLFIYSRTGGRFRWRIRLPVLLAVTKRRRWRLLEQTLERTASPRPPSYLLNNGTFLDRSAKRFRLVSPRTSRYRSDVYVRNPGRRLAGFQVFPESDDAVVWDQNRTEKKNRLPTHPKSRYAELNKHDEGLRAS